MTKNEIFKTARILESMKSSGTAVLRHKVRSKYADLVMKKYVRVGVPKWLFELAYEVYVIAICSAQPSKENSK